MNYFLKANKNLLTYSLILLIVIPIFGFNFFISFVGNILLILLLIPLLLLILVFIGFLMVLDQISANLRMIPSNVLENLSNSNNLISDLLQKLPLLQVGQFAIPLIGFSFMDLLLQALLPSRKVPLKPLLPGSILVGIGLTTLNLAVSKSILSLGVRFQAYGFIGGFLVLTLWVWLLGVILYFGQCWSVVIAGMTLVNKRKKRHNN